MSLQLRYEGTPGQPGTGWFDRGGVERPLHGHFDHTRGKNLAGKPCSRIQAICSRCGGAGGSDRWAHTGWTCFECSGSGRGRVYDVRLYTAAELQVLNDRLGRLRSKRAEKAKAEAEARAVAEAASAAQRASLLAQDPFFVDFRALYATFNPFTYHDEEFDRDDPRPLLPDFLRDMWARVQHTDLSDNQRAAVQKFIDTWKTRERRKAASDFVGEVGKRITVSGAVAFSKVIKYGTWSGDPDRNLIKILTDDEQTLTWFTSKWFDPGARVCGKATVKEHRTYNGVRETQITNLRLSAEPEQKELI